MSKIVEFPNQPYCDTAIVRNWDDQYSVVYSQSPTRGNYFSLVDALGGVAYSARTGCKVKDMEIDSDTVYYCGRSSSGGPVIGYFAVADLMSSTFQENIVSLNFPSDVTSQVSIITPKKIEAFHVSDGVHAIVLVDARFPSDSVKKILVDISSAYSVSTWSSSMCYYGTFAGTENIFFCDDVAVTDNYVFLIGHKRYSAGIYMRKFIKPTCCMGGANDNILYSSGGPNVYDDIYCYYSPGGNVSILGDSYGEHSVYCTHTEGDNVAIACMADYFDGTVNTFGTTVKCINVSSMTLTNGVFYPYSTVYNSSWEVRDLRYDPKNKKILMLHDMDHPINYTLENMVTSVDYPLLSTAMRSWPAYGFPRTSIDRFDGLTDGISSAGTGGTNALRLCTYRPIAANCILVDFPESMRWYGDIVFFRKELTPKFQQNSSIPTTATVGEEPENNMCSE
ncbi:MAG: hypothetical protein IKN11_01870 [Bacteroidales bacterium]|nr:hypothetical protein [Bacteroidales bacterium]